MKALFYGSIRTDGRRLRHLTRIRIFPTVCCAYGIDEVRRMHRYAADAEVRVTTHMRKEEAALAAGAVQYRANLLNSKFCLITRGHQWSARHLWNAVAGLQ